MSDQTLSVYQAADQLGVSVHTVRRWCKDFAAHLSTAANPESGSARRLSAKDMNVLGEVARLRGEKLSPAIINQRLGETVFSAPIVEAAQAAQDSPQQAQTALMVVEAMQSTLAPLVARQEAQEARLQAIETQRQRVDVVVVAVAAFLAGIILGLAVWWFQ